MTASSYDGPVIDCHHHFWDLGMGRHPWLAEGAGLPGLGDLTYLRHDYLPEHLEADSAGQNVAATVCIEALWHGDAAEEIAWLDTLPRRRGIAARYVARANLGEAGAAARLDRLAAHERVAGIRESVRWHPDPARRWSERKLIEDPAWQRGIHLLRGRGLLLELLIYPWQADAVLETARAHPELVIVIDHCGSPVDRDQEGVARWLDGLEAMSRAPNVHLKLSNFARYAATLDAASAWEVIRPCVDRFGAARCLWGSDYPVARHTLPYAATLLLFRAAIAALERSAQEAILFANASRLYGLSDTQGRSRDGET